ncbi:ribbon-helix-helix protein, CopG family [Haloarcula litorea]|uniref:ribbon-helix-helix protein, CopG family n=1 Tax=Haloarcula litorea TaxID=3032579 RepID=UPI0023E8B1A5|nr:ribbon-helix-helix protein, CopG family [Halomicroarcula sp. GDY20]
MASESTEEGAVTIELPPELDEWLDEQAGALGVSREAVVRQLLASYRTTAELDDDATVEGLLDVEAAVEDAMQDELDAAVAAAVADALDGQVDAAVESAVGDRLPEITAAVEDRLDDRVEAEFQEKIEDVRERIVQVKKEADAKAPADHDHPEFEAVDELETELTELNRELVEVRDHVEEELADREAEIDDVDERVDGLAARVDDAEDKLQRVAWVVSDLRDEVGGRDAHQRAVDRIKRAAAQEGISTANCESCGESVDVSLLTDPECPHCGSTVSDVRPEGGIFRTKARLVTAAQLESGADDE